MSTAYNVKRQIRDLVSASIRVAGFRATPAALNEVVRAGNAVDAAIASLQAEHDELLLAAKAVAYSNGFDAAFPEKMEALRAAVARTNGTEVSHG